MDDRALYLSLDDGAWDEMPLSGVRVLERDAQCDQRFVRHVVVRTPLRRLDLITPPEAGAIAPRAARMPGVPHSAIIVDTPVWETVSHWIRTGGGLTGRTIAELARLAAVATSQFAISLGECVAHVAAAMTCEHLGPMRSAGEVSELLRPLEDEARHSPRANEALVAALSRGAALRPYSWV